jgi:hypothetical protein
LTDLQSWVAPTYDQLATLLASGRKENWDAPSLCEKWLVRRVDAYVTMPVRLTSARFKPKWPRQAATSTALDTASDRDALLPVPDPLDQLHSPQLHAWQPPGPGAAGALSRAVIHWT